MVCSNEMLLLLCISLLASSFAFDVEAASRILSEKPYGDPGIQESCDVHSSCDRGCDSSCDAGYSSCDGSCDSSCDKHEQCDSCGLSCSSVSSAPSCTSRTPSRSCCTCTGAAIQCVDSGRTIMLAEECPEIRSLVYAYQEDSSMSRLYFNSFFLVVIPLVIFVECRRRRRMGHDGPMLAVFGPTRSTRAIAPAHVAQPVDEIALADHGPPVVGVAVPVTTTSTMPAASAVALAVPAGSANIPVAHAVAVVPVASASTR
jgi:hypothetical protein